MPHCPRFLTVEHVEVRPVSIAVQTKQRCTGPCVIVPPMVKSLLLLPVLLITACASSLPPGEKTPSLPPPEKTIESLYAPYVSHAAEHGDFGWEKANVYSKRFKGVIDRGFDYSALLDEPVIDYDPIVNAQDYSISKLHIVVDRVPDNGKAHVIAQ